MMLAEMELNHETEEERTWKVDEQFDHATGQDLQTHLLAVHEEGVAERHPSELVAEAEVGDKIDIL